MQMNLALLPLDFIAHSEDRFMISAFWIGELDPKALEEIDSSLWYINRADCVASQIFNHSENAILFLQNYLYSNAFTHCIYQTDTVKYLIDLPSGTVKQLY